jgi:transcriptional regulator with XRE-family HTH domain
MAKEPITKVYSINKELLFRDLEAKRKSSKLSWQRLGHRIGVWPDSMLRLKRNKNSIPSGDTLIAILAFLKQPITKYTINGREDETNANSNKRSPTHRR